MVATLGSFGKYAFNPSNFAMTVTGDLAWGESKEKEIFTIETIKAKKAPDMIITDAPIIMPSTAPDVLDFQYYPITTTPATNQPFYYTTGGSVDVDTTGSPTTTATTNIPMRFDAQIVNIPATARITY